MTIIEIEFQLALGSLTDFDKVIIARITKDVKILALLAKDKHLGVKRSVANNVNTPIEILIILSTDYDGDVRRYVAMNPNTPEELVDKLAATGYSYWDDIVYRKEGFAK